MLTHYMTFCVNVSATDHASVFFVSFTLQVTPPSTMQDELQSEAWQFKVIVIGNSDVGKSSLLRRFHFGVFEEVSMTTIGAEVVSHDMVIDGQLLKVQYAPWSPYFRSHQLCKLHHYCINVWMIFLMFRRSEDKLVHHVKCA